MLCSSWGSLAIWWMRHWYSVIYEAITIQISLIGLAKEFLFKISPPFSAVIIQVYSSKHQKWHSVMLISSRAELSSNATYAITWGKYNQRIYRTLEVVSVYCQVSENHAGVQDKRLMKKRSAELESMTHCLFRNTSFCRTLIQGCITWFAQCELRVGN